ncbi:hypothetical protein [Paenibacillus gorillae]|uniref:hypothetical protein n=1 Tax=Paenibacillus gorillae TaxID=1243662 RepID=UPI0005AA6BC5|nr:hypothetical protein [Paenibacillus gorillae]
MFKPMCYLVISCVIAVCLLSGCAAAKPVAEDSGPTSLVKSYRTMAELAEDAQQIVEIKADSQETIMYQQVPFTLSTVSVIKSFKRDHSQGDTIRIIETGGEYTPLDKQGKALSKTTMKFNGIPVLTRDGHEVIFLSAFGAR